jgi:hypothetical protein
MNEQFLALIRLLGEAGYQIKAIKQKKPQPVKELNGLCPNKPLGDIVLRISPIGKPKSEVTE